MTFDAELPPNDLVAKTVDDESLAKVFDHLDLPPDVQQALLNLPQADRQAILNSPELRELPGRLDAALDRIAQLSNDDLSKIDASSYGLPSSLGNVIEAAKKERQSELAISQIGSAVGIGTTSFSFDTPLSALQTTAATNSFALPTPPAQSSTASNPPEITTAKKTEEEQKQEEKKKGGFDIFKLIAAIVSGKWEEIGKAFNNQNEPPKTADAANQTPNTPPSTNNPVTTTALGTGTDTPKLSLSSISPDILSKSLSVVSSSLGGEYKAANSNAPTVLPQAMFAGGVPTQQGISNSITQQLLAAKQEANVGRTS